MKWTMTVCHIKISCTLLELGISQFEKYSSTLITRHLKTKMVPWCSLFLRCSFSHIPYIIFFESRISLIVWDVLQSVKVVVSFCCLYMFTLDYNSQWTYWAATTSWLSVCQPIRGYMRRRCVFSCCLKTFVGNKERANFKTFRERVRSLEEKSRVNSGAPVKNWINKTFLEHARMKLWRTLSYDSVVESDSEVWDSECGQVLGKHNQFISV